ncbi:MAG TPA: hypothetical protein VHT75_08720 [Acidimicrobiales bacterium]|nr:hypothetical protein [Acidimicrobiales bacterium]
MPYNVAHRKRSQIKVPEITVYFWAVKILSTAMGEATSDYLVHRMDPVIAVTLAGAALLVVLGGQLVVRRYIPAVYWLTVVMVAIFGTMAADVMHIRFGVPYAASAAIFAAVLTVVFLTWYRVEGTLSIHSITTLRRELFYWVTVGTTFALGTAVGDLTAYTFHLGFLSSGILFIAVILIPLLAWRFAGMNEVAAFWFAYIVTRPLGASFADWMGTPHNIGGLNWGRGTVSIGLTVVIVILVAYLSVTGVDTASSTRGINSSSRG